MSLFSNNPPSTGGSAFGSLFGAKPATTSSGSLFGSVAASQPQQGAGSTSTSQPQQSNLFGGFGASTQPTAGSSLFGGLGGAGTQSTSQAQQQSGNTLGSFSGASTQAQPQNSMSASASQGPLQQSQQNGQNNAYFDSILEKSRKRMRGETAGDDLPQLQLGLGDLRQRIKRLAPSTQDRAVDGKAHYLLAASGVDPGAAIRDLNFFNVSTGKVERAPAPQPADSDVEGYLANLQTQTTLSMISDGLSRSIRDFDAFLEDNVTMEWDAQRKRIYEHFGIKAREDMAATGRANFTPSASETPGGFGRSRRSKAAAIASSRASGASGMSTFGKPSLHKSVIGAAASASRGSSQVFADMEKKIEANGVTALPGDRFQRGKQGDFAESVQNLNLARLQKRCYPVCLKFAGVVEKTGEQHGVDLIKAYRALIDIVSENPDIKSLSDPQAVKERQFAKAYLDETPNLTSSTQVKSMILRGGTKCLEKLAYEDIESVINKNPREANIGGIPNVMSKVKAYVRFLAIKKRLAGDNIDLQMLGDDYVWALVYYLLRTGHIQEIVEYVNTNAVAFRAIDRNFSSYITDYCSSLDRRLRRDLQDRINSEYNQRLRIAPENSIDPYRMACYKIIGRCDLKSRNLDGINHNVEDFVWLQIVLAREINRVDEIASETYALADLQKTMREIGARFFLKGGNDIGSSFGAYVFFQIACGMFEEAVAYLYPYSYTDGVHLAIATDFYGLLRVSDPNASGENLLSYTTRANPQINFGRMVGHYTRDFRAANVGAAVDYLALICLNQDLPGQGGTSQVTLCHDALRELILESREFALLLGDVSGDGQRIKGLVEERMKLIALNETDDFIRTISIQAASAADDNGRTTDAVLLYHLAGEYDNVIVILNRALSESVVVPIGQEPLRLQPLKPNSNPDAQQTQYPSLSLVAIDDPLQLGKSMADLYEKSRAYKDKVKNDHFVAFRTLQKMAAAKELVASGRWLEALDIIQVLEILPLQATGNPSTIRRYATKFSSLPQPIASTVPTLLMWTIQCCSNIRAAMMNGQFSGNQGEKESLGEDMRQKNLDMAAYTSQLRYRFPAALHEALARAQSE